MIFALRFEMDRLVTDIKRTDLPPVPDETTFAELQAISAEVQSILSGKWGDEWAMVLARCLVFKCPPEKGVATMNNLYKMSLDAINHSKMCSLGIAEAMRVIEHAMDVPASG